MTHIKKPRNWKKPNKNNKKQDDCFLTKTVCWYFRSKLSNISS